MTQAHSSPPSGRAVIPSMPGIEVRDIMELVSTISPLHASVVAALTTPERGEMTIDGRVRWYAVARRCGVDTQAVLAVRRDLREALLGVDPDIIRERWAQHGNHEA